MEQRTVKKNGFKDKLMYFFVAFVLIFLTSSFVIEDIYSYSDRIQISKDGIEQIFEASIGAIRYEDIEN